MIATITEVQTLHNSDRQIPMLTTDEQAALINRLREVIQQVRKSTIEAGSLLTALRDGTPYGDWENRLRMICGSLNISRRSAYNYMDAYAETLFIPPAIKAACEGASLSLEKPSNRSAVLHEMAANPDASPEEIVRNILESRKPHLNPDAPPTSSKQAQEFETSLASFRFGSGVLVKANQKVFDFTFHSLTETEAKEFISVLTKVEGICD